MKWNREKTYDATDANEYTLSIWAGATGGRWGYHVESPCGKYARGGSRKTKSGAMRAAIYAAKWLYFDKKNNSK